MKATAIFLWFSTFFVSAASVPDIVWSSNAHPVQVFDVRFAAASPFLVTASRDAKVWNTTGGVVRTFTMYQDDIAAAALSPDGARLAAGGGGGKRSLWRVSDGVAIASANLPQTGFGEIAYADNGSMYVMARGESGVISLFNGTNGIGIRFLEDINNFPRNIQFSPDSTLVGASDGSMKLWRASDGELLLSENYNPGAVAFTPDNKYFVFGNPVAFGNPDTATATFWDLQTNGPARVFPAWGPEADFSPDGKLLLLIRDDRLEFWRVADAQLLVRYEDVINPRSLDIAPDGKHFAYGDEVGAVVLARMPLWIHTIARDGNDITLAWQGGSGYYQVQARQTVGNGAWQNLSNPTTNTAFTHSCLSPMFYRVQSLPP